MRSSILLIVATMALSGCMRLGQSEYASTTETMAVTSPASYAVASAAPSNASITPSNPCAAGYDDVITHLEKLMAKKKTPAEPAL